MSIEAMHNNAHANQSVAKSSKQMIGVAPRGTTGQTMTNRQVTQPIWKTSSNTHKIPETTGKQPSKEDELKCYECGQKRTHVTSVSETEEPTHSSGERRRLRRDCRKYRGKL